MATTKTSKTGKRYPGRGTGWGKRRKTRAGRWQASYPDPSYEGPGRAPYIPVGGTLDYPKGYTFDTESEAKEALARVHAAIHEGRWEHPDVMKARRVAEEQQEQRDAYTLREWAGEWMAGLRAKAENPNVKGSVNTVRTYGSKLRAHILPALGDMPLRSITSEVLEDWRNSLLDPERENPMSEQNMLATYRVLSSMLHAAGRKKKIDTVPTVEEAMAKVDPKRPKIERIATLGEVDDMVSNALPWVGVAIVLGYDCALRWEEIAALTRADLIVTGERPRVRINKAVHRHEDGREVLGHTKSDASNREIPIPAYRLPQLQEYLATHVGREQGAHLIHVAGAAPDAYVSNDKMHRGKNRFNEARNAAGLPTSFRFHDLRVTCLTNVGAAGATLADLMLFAGHDDPKTVMRYQTSNANRMRDLSNLVAERTGAEGVRDVTSLDDRRTGTDR